MSFSKKASSFSLFLFFFSGKSILLFEIKKKSLFLANMPHMHGTLWLPQIVPKTTWKGQLHWLNYRYLNTLQYKSWGQNENIGTLSSKVATYHYIKLYTYLKVFTWVNGSSFLKNINPEYSLEGLMLKLKLNTLVTWCEELTHWKRYWCWERLKAKEGKNGWRKLRSFHSITDSVDMNLSKL